MKQQPSIGEILYITSQVSGELNEAKIEYLIYGSLAYFLYTDGQTVSE